MKRLDSYTRKPQITQSIRIFEYHKFSVAEPPASRRARGRACGQECVYVSVLIIDFPHAFPRDYYYINKATISTDQPY
jgi:hypothetical protein